MQARATTGEQAAPTAAPVQADSRVSAEAKVVPARVAGSACRRAGSWPRCWVAEGEQVAAGQTLVRLDSARQAAAVAQAEAQLQRAQAALAELKAGSRATRNAGRPRPRWTLPRPGWIGFETDRCQPRLLPPEAAVAEAQAAERKTLRRLGRAADHRRAGRGPRRRGGGASGPGGVRSGRGRHEHRSPAGIAPTGTCHKCVQRGAGPSDDN